MSTRRWTGGASIIQQVSTVQITADDATTTYKLTINGKVISVLGSGTGVNDTAAALAAAWTASTFAEVKQITATVSTDTITLTGPTTGAPFTVTSSVSGGTGTIGSVTLVTTASSPNDWSVALNWSGAAVPVNADDVVIEGSLPDILYGLGQSAVTLTSLRIESTFSGNIGLPQFNTAGYNEYLPDYLAIGATTVTVGTDTLTTAQTQGLSRFKLDTGSVQTTIRVYGTGTGQDAPGLEAFLFKGTHASNFIEALHGQVGIAVLAGEVATVATLEVGGDAQVRCNSGVTLTTVTQSGGVLQTDSNITTTNHLGGTHLARSGALATITIDAGTVYYTGTGIIGGTAWSIGNAGVLDLSLDLRGRTVGSTGLIYQGARLNDPNSTLGTSAIYQLVRCSEKDVFLDLGPNHTYQVTA